MPSAYYETSIAQFCSTSNANVFGQIHLNSTQQSVTHMQGNAWEEEINVLRNALPSYPNGRILFEFSIPRLGKRINTVVLLGDYVFILEFKTSTLKKEKAKPLAADRAQVWDYALDLKYFHEPSQSLKLVPVLVPTGVPSQDFTLRSSSHDDLVYEPIICNPQDLKTLFQQIYGFGDGAGNGHEQWSKGRYQPTPTIIQAASALYQHQSVANITRTAASGESLAATTEAVQRIIDHAKQHGEKVICFVTGVPGAGKTLVGLNLAMKYFKEGAKSVYLSGNQPLVEVLVAALAKDALSKNKEALAAAEESAETKKVEKRNLKDFEREVQSFIQLVHRYRHETLENIESELKGEKSEKTASTKAEIEHIAIFDEAQRAWTQEKLSAWLAQKHKIINFDKSEPEVLILSLNLHKDWAVIVCLVGEGQEISDGEAGIGEWLNAIQRSFNKDWKVAFANKLLEEPEVAAVAPNLHVEPNEALHLSVSMRSFRAETLSEWVHALLAGQVCKAQELFTSISEHYPIRLTRSIVRAKAWLREQTRGGERMGVVASSKALRLRPLAIDVRQRPDVKHWFLDSKEDVRSSNFLEETAREYDVQGLELDWVCLVWDGDLRWTGSTWNYYHFNGGNWNHTNNPKLAAYQLNAYRVLLTRARQGMVICVPEGDTHDYTRQPSFYDGTYGYLRSLGIKEL